MGVPRTKLASDYYRVAKQRFEDAKFLMQNNRTTGAIYLAGYVVECMLKALLLSQIPKKRQPEVVEAFKSGRGHDLEWLSEQYHNAGGAPFGRDRSVVRAFQIVVGWSSELRYEPGMARPADANNFMEATRVILNWADGRL